MVLTVEQAANRLGVKPLTVRSWILSRRIAYVKIGPARPGALRDTRPVRIPLGVVERFAETVEALR